MFQPYRLDTPEAVPLIYDIAGIGSRFLAAAIDAAIWIALFILLTLGSVGLGTLGPFASEVAAILYLTLSFIILYGYYIIFETIWNGQTPGKRAIGLRVIKRTGRPIGFIDAFIRNLVRIVDFLPAFYGLGVVIMFISIESRRLGDYAANTIVVRDRAPKTVSSLVSQGRPLTVRQPTIGEVDPEELQWDLHALTDEDLSLMRRFVERAPQLTTKAQRTVSQSIAERVASRINAREPLDGWRFIERVLYLRDGPLNKPTNEPE